MGKPWDTIKGGLNSPLSHSNEKHKMLVSEKLKLFKNEVKNKQTYKDIAKGISDLHNSEQGSEEEIPITDTWLRKFTSDPSSVRPTGLQLNLMYRYIDQNGGWDKHMAARNEANELKDGQYFSLLNFFDVPAKTTTNLAVRLPGIYRIYRPVLTHPNHFVIGVVRIWVDEERDVIFFKEHNFMQKLNGREAKNVTLEGYAFKKSNFVSLFASDTTKNSIHITTFTSCETENDQFNVLFGGFFDTLGRTMYSGNVFMERISETENTEGAFVKLSKKACCISHDALPDSIKVYFDGNESSGYVSLF